MKLLLGETSMNRTLVVILSLLAAGPYRQVLAQKPASFNGFDFVDKSGNIRKPTDYRDLYQTLGTYFVLVPKGEIRCT